MSAPLRFGHFEVRPAQRQLLVNGARAALGARAFDVLLALVERRDRVVEKHELLELVWPGLVVEENNLQVQISTLRRLLGPQVIATIPGRGYRLTVVDAASAPAADPAAAPQRADVLPLTNLPSELPPLYGRDADLRTLCALVEANRLVTVVGAGGIGKSRLAQAAAHALAPRWFGGAWMIELAGLSDPARVPNTVAQTLDLVLPGQRAAQDELVAALARRSLLLVLDNCEHLLDAAASLAQALLAGAAGVQVLATSQEPLHLPQEQQCRLAPLALPHSDAPDAARESGAVALFEARVRAARPGFTTDDDELALAVDICRRLDGLPLAIELAAARVATIGLRPLRDKLDARFKLLTGGARATLRRHQTLRAALEWSHQLLDANEQAVFRRLGTFAGGFTMALAQAVATDDRLDEWAVLDQLSALVDKSLVAVDAGDPPRYRLLESARAFALEQLADAGETAAALRRHGEVMRRFLEAIDSANLDGELRTDQYAARVLPELDNLRAAHAWAAGGDGEREVALALAAHAGSLIDYAPECRDWLLSAPRPDDEATLPTALAARYWRAIAAGNMAGFVPRAMQIEAADRARSLYTSLGQPRRVFTSLMQRARLLSRQDTAEARRTAEAAHGLLQPDWPPEFRIIALRTDSFIARDEGQLTAARELFYESVRVSAASADWRLEVMARSNLLDLLWEFGPPEQAVAQARELAAALRNRPAADSDMATAFANVLGTLSEAGHLDEASAIALQALPLMRRSGAFFLEQWAYHCWRRGKHEAAARLVGAVDMQVRRTGVASQPNERRLVDAARAALERELAPERLAAEFTAGAALGNAGLIALIREAIGDGS